MRSRARMPAGHDQIQLMKRKHLTGSPSRAGGNGTAAQGMPLGDTRAGPEPRQPLAVVWWQEPESAGFQVGAAEAWMPDSRLGLRTPSIQEVGMGQVSAAASDHRGRHDRSTVRARRDTRQLVSVRLEKPMVTVIACPRCGGPAEVTERFWLASTDGPVGHVAVRCAVGHGYKMAVDMLDAQTQHQFRTPGSASHAACQVPDDGASHGRGRGGRSRTRTSLAEASGDGTGLR
jgi:hypothetical protein